MTTYGGTTPCPTCGKTLGVGSSSCSYCDGKRDAGCFPAGTLVQLTSESRPIEHVKTGEQVLSFDVRSKTVYSCRVLRVKKYSPANIISIEFDDNSSLKTTRTHSFRVGRKWKMAGKLASGDAITFMDARNNILEKSVTCVLESEKPEVVYNLITEGLHTFLANGAIAHNFTYFRKLRMLYWQIMCLFRRKELGKVEFIGKLHNEVMNTIVSH